jgi:hypothetical protein
VELCGTLHLSAADSGGGIIKEGRSFESFRFKSQFTFMDLAKPQEVHRLPQLSGMHEGYVRIP